MSKRRPWTQSEFEEMLAVVSAWANKNGRSFNQIGYKLINHQNQTSEGPMPFRLTPETRERLDRAIEEMREDNR